MIKNCIENAGKWIDFRPTSAQDLLPATARRRFDHRDDVISGFVSAGFDAATGLEEFRIHVGIEDDRRGNDYLVIEKGDETAEVTSSKQRLF